MNVGLLDVVIDQRTFYTYSESSWSLPRLAFPATLLAGSWRDQCEEYVRL
jgi:hypothetical protein